jgi:hypothetical protein
VKNTTPEDIARTPVPHKKWVMQRFAPIGGVREMVRSMRAKLRSNRKA